MLKGPRPTLTFSQFPTPLGSMVAVTDKEALYLLEFSDRFKQRLALEAVPGETWASHAIQAEIAQYFAGALTQFKTPVVETGSLFQRTVWQALRRIPFGETRSYAALAEMIGQPTAYRAVALANRANRLAILVPCHRVIHANGKLGGYAGGVFRKEQLLQHEANSFTKNTLCLGHG